MQPPFHSDSNAPFFFIAFGQPLSRTKKLPTASCHALSRRDRQAAPSYHSSMASLGLVLLVAVVVSAALMPPSAVAQQLTPDYYASTCPNLEAIVRRSVQQSMAQSQIAAPAALRLFFHDCAVMVRALTLRTYGHVRTANPVAQWCTRADAGLRRVDHDRQLERRRRVAEHRQPVAQAGRVPGHSQRQGRRGQQPAVPVQGVVRGHHGPRRQRSRLPGMYACIIVSLHAVSRCCLVQKEWNLVVSCIAYMLCTQLTLNTLLAPPVAEWRAVLPGGARPVRRQGVD
jgi:hypothetical protein